MPSPHILTGKSTLSPFRRILSAGSPIKRDRITLEAILLRNFSLEAKMVLFKTLYFLSAKVNDPCLTFRLLKTRKTEIKLSEKCDIPQGIASGLLWYIIYSSFLFGLLCKFIYLFFTWNFNVGMR